MGVIASCCGRENNTYICWESNPKSLVTQPEMSQLQKAVKLNNNPEVSCSLKVSLNAELNLASLCRLPVPSSFALVWFMSLIKVDATQSDKQ